MRCLHAIGGRNAAAPCQSFLNFGQALLPDLNADPSISEIDGTFYLYATTDGWGRHLATSGTPVVWTSKDFLNWSFEGSSFPPDFDAKYWAPSSLVPRDGRYYSFPRQAHRLFRRPLPHQAQRRLLLLLPWAVTKCITMPT